MTELNFLLFWLSIGIKRGLNLILFNLWVFTLWPEVHRDNSVIKQYDTAASLRAFSATIYQGPHYCHVRIKNKKYSNYLITSIFIRKSHTHTQTYHSSGRGYTVCLRALSGSYSKDTPAVGFHLACSFPKPFLAYALSRSSWPLRSFTTKISALGSQQKCL